MVAGTPHRPPLALECAPATVSVADACRDVFRGWVGLIAGRLEDEGWEPDEARAFATTVVAAVEGGLLLARVERDTAPVRTVTRHLARRAR